MDIWNYQATVSDPDSIAAALGCSTCVFCQAQLRVLKKDSKAGRVREDLHEEDRLHVETCDLCGWWWAKRENFRLMHNIGKHRFIDPREFHENELWGATAVLKTLDLTDIKAPVSQVRDYLVKKFEQRFTMHPRLFEETVASVFRDLGYDATATAYSGDDGIDVVLVGPAGDTIGVQVKRYKDRIGVDQIRELAGALLLQGTNQGIFVTTSDFQSGAQSTVNRLARLRGMKIELQNADRFYAQLQLAQRRRYHSLDEADAPYRSATFNLIKTENYQREPIDGRYR